MSAADAPVHPEFLETGPIWAKKPIDIPGFLVTLIFWYPMAVYPRLPGTAHDRSGQPAFGDVLFWPEASAQYLLTYNGAYAIL